MFLATRFQSSVGSSLVVIAMASSSPSIAHPEQHGQVEILDAEAVQRNPHRVAVAYAGRKPDLDRIFGDQRAVALAAPTFVGTYRAVPAARRASRPGRNVHLHPPAAPRFLGADDDFHREAFEVFRFGPAEQIEIAPYPFEEFFETRTMLPERFGKSDFAETPGNSGRPERLAARTLPDEQLAGLPTW